MFRPRRRRPPDVAALVDQHLSEGRPTGWFEPLYVAAGEDATAVPWADLSPHPYVVDWLDDPVASPPGGRAVVVGCGLGDDAALLAGRGFDVTAFDVAPSAVAWSRRRFPDASISWRTADLLDLPAELVGAFDLVVEVRTVQSLPGVVRDAAMHAVGALAAPGGVVVAVTLIATDEEARRATTGPPWPQAPSELASYRSAGLVRLALEHPAGVRDGSMEIRLTFQRPTGVPPIRSNPAGGGGRPLLPRGAG